MCNRVLPDFKQMAKGIIDRDQLEDALSRVFHQGYHAGLIDGENQWWVELDNDKAYQEEHE